MKSLTYQERLLQSPAEKNAQEIQYQVSDAHLQLQKNILETGRSLAQARQSLEGVKSANPFNAQAIIDAQLIVESKEDALSRLKALEFELFVSTETKEKMAKAVGDAVDDFFEKVKNSDPAYTPQKNPRPSRAKADKPAEK